MSILFAATYPKRRRATRQLARNDLDTMIRTPVVLAALGIGSRAKRFGAPLVLQSARWRCLANRELNGVAVFHRRRRRRSLFRALRPGDRDGTGEFSR